MTSNYYDEKQKKLDSDTIIRKQWELNQANIEELEYQKKVLRELKGKTSELERLVKQSHVYLKALQSEKTSGNADNQQMTDSKTTEKDN